MANRSPLSKASVQCLDTRPLDWQKLLALEFWCSTAALLAFGFVEYPTACRLVLVICSCSSQIAETLISRAISDILHGSGPRLAQSVLLAGCFAGDSWVFWPPWDGQYNACTADPFSPKILDQTVQSLTPQLLDSVHYWESIFFA